MASHRSALCLVLAAHLLVPFAASRANGGDSRSAAPPGVVKVALRPSVVVTGPLVSIHDVADLSGGAESARSLIGKLDLMDSPYAREKAFISAHHVEFRIRVAGIDRGRFEVVGAPRVEVLRAAAKDVVPASHSASDASKDPAGFQVSKEEILEAARVAVLRRLPGPPDPQDVLIQLAQPFRIPSLPLATRHDLRVEAEAAPSSNVIGRVRVEVSLFVKDRLRASCPVTLEVKVYQPVAVATRAVARGDVVTEDAVRFERQPADHWRSSYSSMDELRKRKVKNYLAAGQVINASDLEPAESDNPVLIKQRDIVRLIARVGALRVTAVGEAMQDGRSGQLIRVRNTDSKNIVLGRVVGRAVVEVDF